MMVSSLYTRPDNRVRVTGHWHLRGGCLYSGEIMVLTPSKVLHFSSTTPMNAEALAQYATDDYLARMAGHFGARA